MLQKKWIVIAAAGVLLVSLVSGGTFAWFSAQASAKVGGLGGDGNGVEGGLAAGHVDVDIKIRSYSTDQNGNVLNANTGVPVSSGEQSTYNRPLIIYPGDLIDFAGNSVAGGVSHIEYTLTNTSGTSIIARTNHAGVTVDQQKPIMTQESDGTKGGFVGPSQFMVYLLKRSVGDKPNTSGANALNWFYLGVSPTGKTDFLFVDKTNLDSNHFIPYFLPKYEKDANGTVQSHLRNVPANTLTSSGAVYPGTTYDPGQFYYEYAAESDPNLIGITSSATVATQYPNVKWTIGQDNVSSQQYIYFYMPKDTSVTVTYNIEIPVPTNCDPMSPELYDNRFQYAVYLLNLKGACGGADVERDDDDNPLFQAYGVQAIAGAVTDFFGPKAYDSLKANLPIR
ncbi:MAG: SipW-dependent-type signal peptide-containing protein [Clostridiales bacterium]|jgi:predicted ribosomally synthesized peptide with SipW-like signal peptide|nr:SipW-dependent-type signal peptide-containing protein [Clostridiales bacterium]